MLWEWVHDALGISPWCSCWNCHNVALELTTSARNAEPSEMLLPWTHSQSIMDSFPDHHGLILRPSWTHSLTVEALYCYWTGSSLPSSFPHSLSSSLSYLPHSPPNPSIHPSPLGSGWLVKEGRLRRKRFFVLTENQQLRYYKSEDTRQPVAGNIHLNWWVEIYYFITLHANDITITSH